MLNMTQRSDLISELESRGFEAGKPSNVGWTFNHPTDGFLVEFNSGGKFLLDLPDGRQERGVMSQPSDLLTIIDREAAAL